MTGGAIGHVPLGQSNLHSTPMEDISWTTYTSRGWAHRGSVTWQQGRAVVFPKLGVIKDEDGKSSCAIRFLVSHLEPAYHLPLDLNHTLRQHISCIQDAQRWQM